MNSSSELAVDVECLKKNNFLAVRKGMPPMGSTLKNAHGIEFVVDGHTSAPTLLRTCEGDEEELYPVLNPLNLSRDLTEFAAEIHRCTPKALVLLDTMPHMFPKRGHPGGYWVDAWSDPYRILFFLDAANLHEAILAHELGHVWIDLVRDIEDNRVLRDKSDPARYAHVQFIQSFVLDIPVNRLIRDKGFGIDIISRDAGTALKNLAAATGRGYVPPSTREAAFLGSFLATLVLAVENHEPGILRFEDRLLALRPFMPEVFKLGEDLASVIHNHPPASKENVRAAVDSALRASFSFCDEDLDIDRELIEIAPEICWEEDKHPEWFAGLSVKAKCEIGVAMARLRASSTARYELSYSSNGRVRIRFEHDDGGFTDHVELEHVGRLPGDPHPHAKLAMELNDKNRRRIDHMMGPNKPSPMPGPGLPGSQGSFPPFPGQRMYSTGLARWISQVRLDQQLRGEHPYAYADNSPVTYTDPSGLETFAGNDRGWACLAWLAPGNWPSHCGLSKQQVMRIIIDTNDDTIGFFGHGGAGRIYLNSDYSEWLNSQDLQTIAYWRWKAHKPKFNYFMVNMCDVMSDPNMINNILKMSKEVQGYKGTCAGICGLRDVWTSPVELPKNAPR